MTGESYLEQHGISEEFAKKFGITWDANFLNIPVKDEAGDDSFIKSRNLKHEEGGSQPKYICSSGSHATLFNYHAVKDVPNIILAEGEVDALRLIQSGIPAVSSTGGAGTFLPEWVELLGTKNVWICYDNDDAGVKATRHLLKLLPNAKTIILPKDTKDISDYFVAGHTKADFFKLSALNKSDWEMKNIPEDFKLVSADDLDKMEFEEHPWLIDNILYSEGFCFIYGAEGTGKSYLTLSIANAVATGKDWLGHFNVPQSTPVLFLDKENPLSMTKRRLKGLNITSKKIYWLKYPEKFQLSDTKGNPSEFALALTEVVKRKKIGLIIMDAFVDLMVGSESSAEDTQRFFEGIRTLFPQIAYLPLHHENKPSQGVFRSDSQRLRGSSNINAQTFTQFRLEAVAKSKTEMTLKQTKSRDALKLSKFMVRMIVESLPEGGTTVKDFEYVGEVEDSVDDSKLSEIKEALKSEISENNFVTRKNAIKMGTSLGASQRTVLRAISNMLSSGEVTKSRRGREVIYVTDMFTEDYDQNEILEDLDGEVV